jgi:hypothetical protein
VNRKDWYFGRLHIWTTKYRDDPQFGWIITRNSYSQKIVLDIWWWKRLIVMRWLGG